MPIIIKEYSWQQTDKSIRIKIASKGVPKNDIDFLTSTRYVKAHFNHYFFELFLSDYIDNTKSNCFITDSEIIFELSKSNSGQWPQLELKADKAEKLELKKLYLENIHEDSEKQATLKCNQKSELKRVAVREQISIDTKFRDNIEQIKKDETEKALSELQLWDITTTKPENNITKTCQNKTKNSFPEDSVKVRNVTQQSVLPLTRKSQTVNVSFTTREFPTPCRESKAQEEEEWLAKQAEARRTAGFVDKDLRPEERNPQWLKEKGDEFFKMNNYLGAVSAYSSGIKLSKNLVSLYVNRSAAHFASGNYHRTIEDCSTALELMIPICQVNLVMRAKCLARRGAALCKMGLLREGASEIEAAYKLLPNDESLKQDLLNVQAQFE